MVIQPTVPKKSDGSVVDGYWCNWGSIVGCFVIRSTFVERTRLSGGGGYLGWRIINELELMKRVSSFILLFNLINYLYIVI